MDFDKLVKIAADLHCFSPGMLSAGGNIDQVRLQLCRWVHSEESRFEQEAFVACPEKALMDLIYLAPSIAIHEYIMELRLQNLEQLNMETFEEMTQRLGRAKLAGIPEVVAELRRPLGMKLSR